MKLFVLFDFWGKLLPKFPLCSCWASIMLVNHISCKPTLLLPGNQRNCCSNFYCFLNLVFYDVFLISSLVREKRSEQKQKKNGWSWPASNFHSMHSVNEESGAGIGRKLLLIAEQYGVTLVCPIHIAHKTENWTFNCHTFPEIKWIIMMSNSCDGKLCTLQFSSEQCPLAFVRQCKWQTSWRQSRSLSSVWSYCTFFPCRRVWS